MEYLPEPSEPIVIVTRRKGLPLALGLVIGILFGILMAFLLARVAVNSGAGVMHRLIASVMGRSTSIDTSAPAIVEKIRKLSRLETVIYSMDKIVEGDRENAVLPSFLTGDKLLLIAHGEVIAGVDLSQLQSGDVSVNRDTVRIHLPAAQVLTTRIDNGRTRVYSRITGLLVTPDPNLETQVRQAAEQQIAQAAVADGILDRARQNAQTAVTALLYGLGFHTVTVT